MIDFFGAYYSITNTFDDPTDYRHGQPILYGAPRLHFIQCAPDVFYIRLAKDEMENDTAAEFVCDMTLWSADNQPAAYQYMMTGDKSGLHPVTQAIIAQDEAAGIDTEDIVEMRAGIMTMEFLGFVPGHVFMVKPELAGNNEIEMEGETVIVPRFAPGSWYDLDNPEFI